LETTSNDYSRADGFTMIAQPTAGTLGNRGLRSHTELDGHGAYIPVAQPVPYDLFQITAPVNRQNRKPGDPCHTLARDNAAHAAVAQAMTVRRLTPRECERLQGFPDDWTLIPYRGKPADQCPDGPRYKALGNSMACNCMAWIGERIAAVHSRHDQRAAP
jgi:site-specific DNA-cytosine methylase